MTDCVPGRVSVIIPAYNHAAYIRACVDSALNQTYPGVEVVIVDDGSTDGTYEILQTYGDRIRLLRQENQGTEAARNAAIRASTGEFMALLDSDDMWLPTKLERQMQLFESYPDTALVYSLATRIGPDGLPVGDAVVIGLDLPQPDCAYESLLQGCHIPALTAIFRRSCLQVVGLFDESISGSGDWDMWLKIAERWPVRCVPEVLACYRVHPTNTTKVLFATRQVLADHNRVLDRYLDKPGGPRVPTFVANRARARVELTGAECAALEGRGAEAGLHLAKAINIDASLLNDATWVRNQILALVEAAAQRTWPARRQFVTVMIRSMSVTGTVTQRAFRHVEGELALSHAFSLYANGERCALFEPLLTAIRRNPAYLRNGDVHAMLATAVLGPRLKSYASTLLRRIGCFT